MAPAQNTHSVGQRRKRGRPPNPGLRAVKHARMLKAAMELFIERGYEHVTVQQIADSAGRSKGAFYWYFKGKEDCLSQITDTVASKVEETVSRELGKGGGACEQLLRLTDVATWGPQEFGRYSLLLDSMIFSRSVKARTLGVKTASHIYQSLFKTVRELGMAAAAESGWPRERIEGFDFDHWAYGCLVFYDGLLEFLNHNYLNFAPETKAITLVFHAAFVTPIIGERALKKHGQAGL
jgi:AcrR family transcriptional regulator